MAGCLLAFEALDALAFRPFGDVIETAGAAVRLINQGTTTRYDCAARIDVGTSGGRPHLALFRATRRARPITISMMERHPLGSQAFVPLSDGDWLVVVAPGDGPPDPMALRCFRATRHQGVNIARNVWHHPLLVLAPEQTFLVLERAGNGDNLEEVTFSNEADSRFIDL